MKINWSLNRSLAKNVSKTTQILIENLSLQCFLGLLLTFFLKNLEIYFKNTEEKFGTESAK